ncbi:MAG: FecR domain-containing protein [Deltaproteobacteria bacterium]|nr:FecR domain-containing protein [Deltaproteobacteria bacterium]
MKHRIFTVFVILIFLLGSSQAILGQEAAAPDRGNMVPAEMLPGELQGLDIKDYFIGADVREAGVIETMTGHAAVIHGDSDQAYFAAPGDKIFEKDVIFTLKESRCRVKFLDDNLITMAEDTSIDIKEFVVDLEMKEKRSIFGMAKGKAMFYALKLFKYGKVSMSVETPTAVAGVRGTKFGVAVREVQGKSVASRPVYLADASDSGWIYLARANPGATETIVYAFDGEIEVHSPVDGTTQVLEPGNMLTCTGEGAGAVEPTPPGEARQFEGTTEAPTPEGEEGTGADEGETGGEAETSAEAEPSETDVIEETPDTTDITQDQTTKAAEKPSDPVRDPGTNATGTGVGYFSGMLTNQSDSSLEEFFVSTKRQDFDGENMWARGSKDPSADYLRADPEYFTETAYAKWVVFNSGANSSTDLGESKPITHAELPGSADCEYLEWGYWTMADSITVDDKTYLINNKGYYICGDDTSSMPTTTTATYSGDAYGTYWIAGGGTDMTGEFSCYVNFGTAEISDFDIDVLGGERTVYIHDGSGIYNSDGTFSIANGTWNLDGAEGPPDHTMCHGSFYGTDAASIGGAWGMDEGDEGVVGIFQGDKGEQIVTP